MENIYLHGIYSRASASNPEGSIEVLDDILSSDYILSRHQQEIEYQIQYTKIERFNGKDYISLCDYDLRYRSSMEFSNYTAFDLFIRKSLAIFFNKQNIHPETISPVPPQTGFDEAEKIRNKNPLYQNIRFSDLLDEVQVKDKISLDYMEGITIPIKYIYIMSTSLEAARKRIIYYLNNIDELLRKYNRKKHIYNLDDFQELKTTDDIERALKK